MQLHIPAQALGGSGWRSTASQRWRGCCRCCTTPAAACWPRWTALHQGASSSVVPLAVVIYSCPFVLAFEVSSLQLHCKRDPLPVGPLDGPAPGGLLVCGPPSSGTALLHSFCGPLWLCCMCRLGMSAAVNMTLMIRVACHLDLHKLPRAIYQLHGDFLACLRRASLMHVSMLMVGSAWQGRQA